MGVLYFANIDGEWESIVDKLFELDNKCCFSVFFDGEISCCPGEPEDNDWITIPDLADARQLLHKAYERDGEFALNILHNAFEAVTICCIKKGSIGLILDARAASPDEFITAATELLDQLGGKVHKIRFSDDLTGNW